jgi:hypothetical protein
MVLSVGVLALAPAANAGQSKLLKAVTMPVTCGAPSLFSALTAFGDARSYFVVPGGDFETGALGWTTTGGAGVVAGGGPLQLDGGGSALKLPAGSTATSPTFCVDLDSPTYRFFASQLAAKADATLSVDMLYADQSGQTPTTATLSNLPSAWSLVNDIALPSARLDQAGGLRQMRLRFRATSGDWAIDDVLIDPRMRS